MDGTLLVKLETALASLKAKGVSEADVGVVLRRLINSPLVALLVGMTANKVDDAVLELLKTLFPASA